MSLFLDWRFSLYILVELCSVLCVTKKLLINEDDDDDDDNDEFHFLLWRKKTIWCHVCHYSKCRSYLPDIGKYVANDIRRCPHHFHSFLASVSLYSKQTTKTVLSLSWLVNAQQDEYLRSKFVLKNLWGGGGGCWARPPPHVSWEWQIPPQTILPRRRCWLAV